MFELFDYGFCAVINSRPRFGFFALSPKPEFLLSILSFVSVGSFSVLVDFGIILVFACPNRCSIQEHWGKNDWIKLYIF